jgi:4-aminobutyrate aminotransferase-like enzyme
LTARWCWPSHHILSAGIIVGVCGSLADVVRIQPPLILAEDEATEVTDNLTPILKEMNQGL